MRPDHPDYGNSRFKMRAAVEENQGTLQISLNATFLHVPTLNQVNNSFFKVRDLVNSTIGTCHSNIRLLFNESETRAKTKCTCK